MKTVETEMWIEKQAEHIYRSIMLLPWNFWYIDSAIDTHLLSSCPTFGRRTKQICRAYVIPPAGK